MDTLAAQKRVYQNKIDKGFDTSNMDLQFLYMHSEVTEAFEAFHNKGDLGLELADIAIYVLGFAEMQGINLGEEIEKKMAINERRTYVEVDGVWTKIEGAID